MHNANLTQAQFQGDFAKDKRLYI